MRTRLTMLLAAAAVVALSGCGDDASTNTAGLAPRTETQPSNQDRTWMAAIHQGNLAEVQAGRLAQGKGTTKRIKSIGKTLVDDHTKLDEKVTQTATQLGITLPTSPTADQSAVVARLQDATGKDFDQDFVSGMTKAHRDAIAATKQEISQGSSPAVVSLAKTAEPSLQTHLKALRNAQGD
jgi:putative membrane protein